MKKTIITMLLLSLLAGGAYAKYDIIESKPANVGGITQNFHQETNSGEYPHFYNGWITPYSGEYFLYADRKIDEMAAFGFTRNDIHPYHNLILAKVDYISFYLSTTFNAIKSDNHFPWTYENDPCDWVISFYYKKNLINQV